jgi:hypothetical protein
MARTPKPSARLLARAAALVAALGIAAAAQATAPAPQSDELFRAWTAAVADRGLPVPGATYELMIGNWRGLPGRSWADVLNHRIYLSPEIEREAQDAGFPQGRREMRLQLLHELGHALDAELTAADRAAYAAIMDDHRPWFAPDDEHVDLDSPPSERFAVAYSAVAAGLPYSRLRPDYGFRPRRAQYRQLVRWFHALAVTRSAAQAATGMTSRVGSPRPRNVA